MSVPASQPQVSKFREWLVDRVKESGWVGYSGEDDEQLSSRLGVRPEVLVEARNSLADEYRREGREPLDVGTRRRRQFPAQPRYEVVLPKVVHKDWLVYCRARQLDESTVLRSIVHYLLSRPQNPGPITYRWWYRGRCYRVCKERGGRKKTGKFITSVEARITNGARAALTRRARSLNVHPSALVRAVMMDLLEGRLKSLPVVNIDQMWDDPNRYWCKGR